MAGYPTKHRGNGQDSSFRRLPSSSFPCETEGPFSTDDHTNRSTCNPSENAPQPFCVDSRGFSFTNTNTWISYPEPDLSAFSNHLYPVYGDPSITALQSSRTAINPSKEIAPNHVHGHGTLSNPNGRMDTASSLQLHNTHHSSANFAPSVHSSLLPSPPGCHSPTDVNPPRNTWKPTYLTQNIATGLSTFSAHPAGVTLDPNPISGSVLPQYVQETLVPDLRTQPMHPNVTHDPQQVRSDKRKGNPVEHLPRDKNGYTTPILVFILLLYTSRTFKTQELERICLPPGDKCIKQKDGKIECRIMASVSPRGIAIWEKSSQRCGNIFINIDNYRKHILQCHLGCPRQDGKFQLDVVDERFTEAAREMAFQVLMGLAK